MKKTHPLKSGTFRMTHENRDQFYCVEKQENGYACKAPEPVQIFLAERFASEVCAWKAIICIRTDNPSANQWHIKNLERCEKLVREDFDKQVFVGQCLSKDWLIFQEGTHRSDVIAWMNAVFC